MSIKFLKLKIAYYLLLLQYNTMLQSFYRCIQYCAQM